MVQIWDEWIEQFAKYKKAQLEKELEILLMSNDYIEAVEMGYFCSKDVASGYFDNKPPVIAFLKKIDNIYIIFMNTIKKDDEILVCDNKDEALEELKNLEYSLCMPINIQIELFYSELKDYKNRLRIEVYPASYYSEKFYSFSIFLDNKFVKNSLNNLSAKDFINDIRKIDNK